MVQIATTTNHLLQDKLMRNIMHSNIMDIYGIKNED